MKQSVESMEVKSAITEISAGTKNRNVTHSLTSCLHNKGNNEKVVLKKNNKNKVKKISRLKRLFGKKSKKNKSKGSNAVSQLETIEDESSSVGEKTTPSSTQSSPTFERIEKKPSPVSSQKKLQDHQKHQEEEKVSVSDLKFLEAGNSKEAKRLQFESIQRLKNLSQQEFLASNRKLNKSKKESNNKYLLSSDNLGNSNFFQYDDESTFIDDNTMESSMTEDATLATVDDSLQSSSVTDKVPPKVFNCTTRKCEYDIADDYELTGYRTILSKAKLNDTQKQKGVMSKIMEAGSLKNVLCGETNNLCMENNNLCTEEGYDLNTDHGTFDAGTFDAGTFDAGTFDATTIHTLDSTFATQRGDSETISTTGRTKDSTVVTKDYTEATTYMTGRSDSETVSTTGRTKDDTLSTSYVSEQSEGETISTKGNETISSKGKKTISSKGKETVSTKGIETVSTKGNETISTKGKIKEDNPGSVSKNSNNSHSQLRQKQSLLKNDKLPEEKKKVKKLVSQAYLRQKESLLGIDTHPEQDQKGADPTLSMKDSIQSPASSNTITASVGNGIWDDSQLSQIDTLTLTRSALSRPFGRTSLPTALAKQWLVELSTPKWSEEEKRWKYVVAVYKDEFTPTQASYDKSINHSNKNLSTPTHKLESSCGNSVSSSTFAAANTSRSLHDFIWLEQSLRDEYNGSLLIPLLSMTLTNVNDLTKLNDLKRKKVNIDAWDPKANSSLKLESLITNHSKVEPKILAQWLSDILNGVRGKGELLLRLPSVDVMSSESMETFLYKNIDFTRALCHKDNEGAKQSSFNLSSFNSLLGSSVECIDSRQGKNDIKASLNDLKRYRERLFPRESVERLKTTMKNRLPPEMLSLVPRTEGTHAKPRESIQNRFLLDKIACVSLTGGTAALSNLHSLYPTSSKLAHNSEILNAEYCLIKHNRKVTLQAIYKLRLLLDQEMMIGTAWKRFAISLSCLYAVQKDLQNARMKTQSNKNNEKKSQTRSFEKQFIDDRLRLLARQRVDRSVPSLKVLSAMLNTYFSDLSAVEPSLESHSNAVKRLATLDSKSFQAREEMLKTLALFKKSLNSGNSSNIESKASSSLDNMTHDSPRRRAYEQQVTENEKLILTTLTQFCRCVPIRTSRMAWKFFKMETGQAGLLGSAANSFKKALDDSSNSKPISGNKLHHEIEERTDDEKEILLVQNILAVTTKKKYKINPLTTSSLTGSESTTERDIDIDFDAEEDELTPLASKALNLAKERAGRWDTKLALAIMEAAGIKDAAVKVKETTRDTRLVRKLVIALREGLERCISAMEMLSEFLSKGSPDVSSSDSFELIEKVRESFFTSLSSVLSGTLSADDKKSHLSTSLSVLSSVGVETSDHRGWLTINDSVSCLDRKNKTNCGEAAKKCFLGRDKGLVELIDTMKSILAECKFRVEGLEGFIYMNCVGNQLEKHFSNIRVNELSAWEKKTDVTTAINIATRKKLSDLVVQLQSKLDAMNENVSHTSVKEAKDKHLASKILKSDLQEIASRRFKRAQEIATDQVLQIINLWIEYEEKMANEQVAASRLVVQKIEESVTRNSILGDGGSHLFALRTCGKTQ